MPFGWAARFWKQQPKWENGLLPQRRVRRLADEMEAAEGLVIKNKEAIFKVKRSKQ